ncbi:MAG: hypothetical protein K0S54_2065 [Alphaproteobacteria bacterium]|nr:hypothetical protein [Alphaproteobacteria bacterium]
MLRHVSTAAIIATCFVATPVMAQCGSHNLETSQDTTGAAPIELAQTRDGTTLREQENRRSGGDGTAVPPNTLRPRGDTTGAGQNQGSPPGTSSGRGTFSSPSTTGNPNSPAPGADTSQSGGDGDSGSGGGAGSGSGGSGSGGGGSGGGSGG